MPYIRHESLFALKELYQMEQKDRFREIFATVDITPILRLVRKTSHLGAPIEVNYRATVYSLIVRILERIPTIKDHIKRLQNDILFRLDCSFMLSEAIPSPSSFSRWIHKMSQSHALEEMQERLLKQAMAESFITDDTTAIDAIHIEARDQAPAKQEKEKPAPQKRGHKSKAEREAWLAKKQEDEQQKPVFQNEIVQLDETFPVLRNEMPLTPQWEVKKNSDGKNFLVRLQRSSCRGNPMSVYCGCDAFFR